MYPHQTLQKVVILLPVMLIGWNTADPIQISDITHRLGLDDLKRSLSLDGGLSGLVEGGAEKLGYIPIREAVQNCEGKARYRVMHELDRLRTEGEKIFEQISKDIEARCRGYVEFAGRQCQAKVESLAEALQVDGRAQLTKAQEKCSRETEELTNRTLEEETRRFEQIGKETETRVRKEYEERGKVEEVQIRTEFEDRGKALESKIRKEYEKRGKDEEEKVRREFLLRGNLTAATVELELRKRGEEEMKKIRAELEQRGKDLEVVIRKEFEDRGEVERKNIEEEFRERGRVLREEGEKECTEMIEKACEAVQPGTESDDFCLDFFFFTGKRYKRKTLFSRLKY